MELTGKVIDVKERKGTKSDCQNDLSKLLISFSNILNSDIIFFRFLVKSLQVY